MDEKMDEEIGEKKQMREIFAQRFSKLRAEKGMNQATFAEYLELNRAAVSFYENAYKAGGRLPDLVTLRRLCAKLNVSADYLLGLSDERVYVLDAASKLGFSKSAAKKLCHEYLIDCSDGTISALNKMIPVASSDDFFNAVNKLCFEIDTELMVGPFEIARYITDTDTTPEEKQRETEPNEKAMNEYDRFLMRWMKYLQAMTNSNFSESIVPAMKRVVDEILKASIDKHNQLSAYIRKKCED